MSHARKKAPWTEKLEAILARDGNDKCSDCDTPNPRWISANIGCIICIRCSGIHRSLGTHISRVRSVELDDWTDEQLQFLDRKGNKKINLIFEANIPPTTKKITAQTSFEEATAYIKAKYNGQFKSAAANGWKGATVAPDADDEKKRATGAAGTSKDEDWELRRRTLLLKHSARVQQSVSQDSLSAPGADTDSDQDSTESPGGTPGRVLSEDLSIKARAQIKKVSLSGSDDVVDEVWNTLEQTGVGADLKKMQSEERKRMMNEAKLKREAKKKEEKERKKKEDEEQKQKRKTDKQKEKRKTWWRGRALDSDSIALSHEMDQLMQNQAEDALFFLAINNDAEIKNKRENDHRKVRERMRIYEAAKRQLRGQTEETTCPHCHSHFPASHPPAASTT